MVRSGVVDHSREWKHGGWHEIVDPPRRYRIIARNRLKQLLGADEKTLTDSYEHWVEAYIQKGTKQEKIWTEAIAAGSDEFVESIKARLGIKASIDEPTERKVLKRILCMRYRSPCCLQR